MALCEENLLMDVLSEDVLLRMCLFLPGKALMDLSMTSRLLQPRANDSPTVWRSLCESLLGAGLVQLHREAWASTPVASEGLDSARFLKSLFRAAYHCRSFSYALQIRKRCLEGGAFAGFSFTPPPRTLDEEDAQFYETTATTSSSLDTVALRRREDWNDALAVSGPSSCAVGHLIVNIGGSRPNSNDTELLVCIINIAHGAVIRPQLSPNSLRPGRRTRHTSCVVHQRACKAGQLPPVLVLGGCHDQTSQPCGGLDTLLYLEVVKDDGSEVCWREEVAEGCAPRAIWHHLAGSFAQGRKVVVFGGDMVPSDPEFERISERARAAHVYILDVEARCWERVATTGHVPIWRSLHKGVTYTSLADGSDRLVILGGCVSHVALHGQGTLADMVGYSLNLGTYEWQKGDTRQTAGEAPVFLPQPRNRFAADRYGRHLLVYGGMNHGGGGPFLGEIPSDQQLLTLNLMTLRWSRVEEVNRPHSWRYIPGSSLAGGVLTGGFILNDPFVGLRLVPKFDVVCLAPPIAGEVDSDDEAAMREDGEETEVGDESLDDVAFQGHPHFLARGVAGRMFGMTQLHGAAALAFLRQHLNPPAFGNQQPMPESSDEED